MEESPVPASGKRRLRIKRACEPCRKRKRKCDGHHPCNQCLEYEYSCSFSGMNDEETRGVSQNAQNAQNVPSDRIGISEANVSRRDNWIETFDLSGRPTQNQSRERSPERSPECRRNFPVIDFEKGRYSNPHGGMVLARKLGQDIGLPKELRLHSYGWNLSLRTEQHSILLPAVRRYLTLEDTLRYSQIYFDVVDPVYHFMDNARYFDRCTRYLLANNPNLGDFEAVISGVVSLGSFFAANPSTAESQLVEHAKLILDAGSAYAPGLLSLDQATAWILRTLYLRLTTRPHLSWFASCATMHIIEAMGLHIDLTTVDLVGSGPEVLTAELIASRKKIFECASFVNAVISADYGRSRVSLQPHRIRNTQPSTATSATVLSELTKLLAASENSLRPGEKNNILNSIRDFPAERPLLVLLKTDVAIHMYRNQFYMARENPTDAERTVIISIIKDALQEVQQFLPNRQPWWNVLFTPFQCLLVLLAMDTDDSLSVVPEAISTLRAVYDTFHTHLVEEVLQTASSLIQGLEKRKVKQASFLSTAGGSCSVSHDGSSAIDDSLLASQSQSFLDDWFNREIDWTQFFKADSLTNIQYP
jgi:Fungal Zn(2)-Cys(6) binuclear cluster domain